MSDEELLGVLREAVGHGPVLLLPAPTREGGLKAQPLPHVVRLRNAQPDIPEICKAASGLQPLGRVTVVIDGAEALPEPLDGEAADAVIGALLDGLPEQVDAIALLP